MRSLAASLPAFWDTPQGRPAEAPVTLWNGGSANYATLSSWSGEATSESGINELYFSFAQRDTDAELFFDGKRTHRVRGGGQHVLFAPSQSKVKTQVRSHYDVDAVAIRLTDAFLISCAERDKRQLTELHPALDSLDDVDWLFARVIREECRRGAPNGVLCIETAAAMLGISLLRKQLSAQIPLGAVRKGGLSPLALRIACEYLMERLDEDVHLSDVAAVVGLSIGHFALAFKKSTGRSPHAWLRSKRIEKARALLTRPELSIGDIAPLVGYANQASFGLAFRQEIGLSPRAWRRLT
ncbi:helix-turn-helix transcriptional regulator [Bradyrhizobium liaoningense]|uniref:helix-turn-helix domain-containing protein n=1 Tax=Bradyrhizobium liaoningense TaxID=43992 RepID=UPI001BA98099|nr:AraC family transcriptional regulator [Bradyrhizobium liaoningense]MBR0839316.1 helix-turn-helix transcriptional regulator [Bradyrhizobium liaoningense]